MSENSLMTYIWYQVRGVFKTINTHGNAKEQFLKKPLTALDEPQRRLQQKTAQLEWFEDTHYSNKLEQFLHLSKVNAFQQ